MSRSTEVRIQTDRREDLDLNTYENNPYLTTPGTSVGERILGFVYQIGFVLRGDGRNSCGYLLAFGTKRALRALERNRIHAVEKRLKNTSFMESFVSEKKLIAVVGATGAQGGGLVRAILNDPQGGFNVRAITRDVNSDKAKELAKLGAEVVAADVNDPESLKHAFKGAHGAFCVTFFWADMSPENEKTQATNMARAAKDAGVQHAIWSTFEDTRKHIPLSDNRMPTLMGKYKVAHFDAKNEANKAFTDLGVPTTFLLTSFYWENFIYFGAGPKKGPDGKLALTLPMGDKKLPAISSEDIGKCAYGIFKKGRELVGKTVGVAGDHLTGAQMAAAFSKALGREVRYNDVPPEVYRSFGFPGAEDMGNMFQFKRDFEQIYTGARSVEFSRSLNPALQSFEQWLKHNISRIPLE
jgi:uncharacterized protein YbjT (DUF2867 family)